MRNDQLHTDSTLFARIAEGDEAAFELLFLRYVPRIEPVILRITGTEVALKDIVQEVFLQLWLNRHRLPDVAEPDNWIFKMVYNRSYTWVKKQLVREHYRQQAPADVHDPEEWHSFEETTRLVQQAIHALSPQAKKIFQLKESGLRAIEIAAALGITVDGVKKSLYRSTQHIRDYLITRGIQIPFVLLIWWLKK